MHGPGPATPTNPPGWSPTYPVPISVIDTFASSLRASRRDYWRRIRSAGFEMWPVPFRFEEHPASDFGEFEVIRDAIRIIRGEDGNDSGGWIADPGGGLMVLGPWPPWWKPYWFRSAAAIVGHESGHCLGLWHRMHGGIMAGARRPDEHDLQSIADWYGRGIG
jgi:hypothetical protein